MKQVEIYTDGACSGNPGIGGWGVLLITKGAEKELFGAEAETTNNRMELMAAIQGLKALKYSCHVDLYTDSVYVKNGITTWLSDWKAKGWKTATRKPVKNQDLWMELEEIQGKHQVSWHWIKGHAGHPQNERADQLARFAIKKLKDQQI